MWLIIIGLGITGAALLERDSKAERAEKRFNMAQSVEDRCAAATDAKDAYLDAGDRDRYTRWRLEVAVACE